MRIGVPEEIKKDENRVAITPSGVHAFVQNGHEVLVEKDAGLGSGISNEDFASAGAKIVDKPADVFGQADMIIKVKEPQASEFGLLRPGQVLFTYLHLAAEPGVTRALLDRKVVGIAYETVQEADGSLPLLAPMSEVAGRMAVQIGARFLEKRVGGAGVLLGGVPGVPPAEVVIIGGGSVGVNAAKMAVGLGAHVTVLDINLSRLRHLDDLFGGRLVTIASNSYNIDKTVPQADLLIGAVLVPGAKAPRLVRVDTVKKMRKGSVVVDVAIDQGGSIATIDRITSHSDPTYTVHGVVHYSVPNIPGAVPRTSTFALTNATMPYALRLASDNWETVLKSNPALRRGLNVVGGYVVNRAVAEAHGLECTPLEAAT